MLERVTLTESRAGTAPQSGKTQLYRCVMWVSFVFWGSYYVLLGCKSKYSAPRPTRGDIRKLVSTFLQPTLVPTNTLLNLFCTFLFLFIGVTFNQTIIKGPHFKQQPQAVKVQKWPIKIHCFHSSYTSLFSQHEQVQASLV